MIPVLRAPRLTLPQTWQAHRMATILTTTYRKNRFGAIIIALHNFDTLPVRFNASRRRASQSFADPFAGEDDDFTSGDESDNDAGDETSVISGSDEDNAPRFNGELTTRIGSSTCPEGNVQVCPRTEAPCHYIEHFHPIATLNPHSSWQSVGVSPKIQNCCRVYQARVRVIVTRYNSIRA